MIVHLFLIFVNRTYVMAESNVDAITLRLPNFWETNVTGWFRHIESQFTARNITRDPTKFSHLMSALDEKVVSRINDLLDVVPEEDSYNWLKEKLIERYDISEGDRIDMLLDMPPSDRRPSEQLQYMRSIYRPKENCPWFRRVFSRACPREIAALFAHDETSTLDVLARHADSYLARQGPSAVSSTSGWRAPPSSRSEAVNDNDNETVWLFSLYMYMLFNIIFLFVIMNKFKKSKEISAREFNLLQLIARNYNNFF